MSDYTDFEIFFKQNYYKFFAYAFRFTGNEEDSKDIVLESLEFVWEHRSEGGISNMTTFAYSVIRNKSIDLIRHQVVVNKFTSLYLNLLDGMSDDSSADVDERLVLINEQLSRLSDKTNYVFRQCFLEGRKYKELAEELGISVSGVKKHIVKALKEIRTGVEKSKNMRNKSNGSAL